VDLFELSGAIHILDLLYVIVAYNDAVSEDHLLSLPCDGGPIGCGVASVSSLPGYIRENYWIEPDHPPVSFVWQPLKRSISTSFCQLYQYPTPV